MAIFSSHPFSTPQKIVPQPAAPAAEGSTEPADIHTMPGKFMAQEKKVSWFKQRLTIGILIVVGVGGGMGFAAWYFVKSLQPPAPVPTPTPLPGTALTPTPEPTLPQESPPVTSTPLPTPTPEPPPPTPAPTSTPTPPPVETPPPPIVLPLSPDADGDQMTDEEERLWRTDSQKPDTDADGYLDGEELLLRFDPALGSGARLTQSPQVRVYTNPQLAYTMLVPASWENRLIDPTSALQTMFVASTGEFVSVIAQQNVEGYATARDWYINEYNIADPGTLPAITTPSLTGTMSADGMASYFLEGGYLYVISYNPGIRDSINFKTTYRMMVQSFRPVKEP